MSKETTAPLTDAKVSEIDRALANAKNKQAQRKATAGGNTATPTKAPKAPKPAKEPSAPKRPRLSDEDKAARALVKDADRAAKKATRDVARAAKKAERDASRSPAHMRKVAKAAERLGSMSNDAQLLFNEATANLSAANVANLALHLQHFNRVKATERALARSIKTGQTVTIVGGDPRFIGQTGTVTKALRIRCYVQVEGAKKPVYLFTSDVEVAVPVAAQEAAAG
jgi:hypothetical protein